MKTKPRAVLVVDDSSIARKSLIKRFPETWDVVVDQAGNGAEALEAYRSKGHELIFLDLNMPVMDGYQVLESLQSEHLPTIVVLSGDIQPKAQERVSALGAAAFIKKPCSPEDITRVLRECGVL